jgi:hypothetical protein
MLSYPVKESNKIREILEALPPEKRLFRINSGMGWTGKVIRNDGKVLVMENPRPLRAAPQGWPDLAGWTMIEITPDMIGQKIAVFTAEEVKITGRLSKAQAAFKKILESMGGIFKVVK